MVSILLRSTLTVSSISTQSNPSFNLDPTPSRLNFLLYLLI
ncbi:unnamed protein product [Spirodela intermedia]|uniref:Uncharacterized protein n=2 Tax=Spirodela intermedia TaxID=51605 RepID=A0A7I8L2Q3_SPIIN|nr:unnamed protein product [Spirodela intermedia]CAA6667063.1 unnamed protein product [Spirodela intermedia]CAA7403876.1 unnamed protein product [Spirodela intermedia]